MTEIKISTNSVEKLLFRTLNEKEKNVESVKVWLSDNSVYIKLNQLKYKVLFIDRINLEIKINASLDGSKLDLYPKLQGWKAVIQIVGPIILWFLKLFNLMNFKDNYFEIVDTSHISIYLDRLTIAKQSEVKKEALTDLIDIHSFQLPSKENVLEVMFEVK
jgi:hypothetical protein